MQLGARPHDLGDEIDAIGLLPGHGGLGSALALASDNDDAALAGLVLGKAAIHAVLFEVGWPNVAADVGAIDLDRAGERCALAISLADRFAELVAEHEGRPVLHVEIAAELQSADALGAVARGWRWPEGSREPRSLRLAKIVPDVTLNCWVQSLHFQSLRVL